MKKSLCKPALTLLLALGLSACAHAPKDANQTETNDAQSQAQLKPEAHQTAQGRTFTLVRMPKAEQVEIRFVWNGGSAFIERGKENIQQLGPALMFSAGVKDLPPDELTAKLDELSARLSLYSYSTALQGRIGAPMQHINQAATIFRRVLSEPTLDARWLRRLKRDQIESLTNALNQPNVQAWRALRTLVIEDHPLRQVWNYNSLDGLKSISAKDIQNWHQRSLSQEDVDVFVGAPIQNDAELASIATAIDEVLQALPQSSERQNYDPVQVHYPAKTILVHRPDLEKSYVLVAGPITPTYQPGQEARELGVGVLGVTDQSRLNTAIRKELRAAYGFGAWMSPLGRQNTLLHMHGEVETQQLPEVLEKIASTYETLRLDGITQLEFPFASRIYRNRAKDHARYPGNITAWMAEAHLTDRTIEHGLAYPERAAALELQLRSPQRISTVS